MEIAAIILAAGASSRLGYPKQLLPFRNKPFILHTVAQAKLAGLQPIIVVTGCHHEKVEDVLQNQDCHIVFNEIWKQGKGTSIAKGVETIIHSYPDVNTVVISVSDQPFLIAQIFSNLIKSYKNQDSKIIASAYANTVGVPVLFSKTHFIFLASLSQDEGAGNLLSRYADDVITIPFPGGEKDIDTPEDLQMLAE